MRPEFKRAYHFVNSENALDDLKKRRIKVSTYDLVNDPHEGSACDLRVVPSRQLVGHLYSTTLQETFCFTCLSLDSQNSVLWERYGDLHKGICLGFDVKAALLDRVDYVATCKLVDVPEKCFLDVQSKAANRSLQTGRRQFDRSVRALSYFVRQQILTKLAVGHDRDAKSCEWYREEEWRMFISKTGQEDGMYFVKFGNTLRLKEVI